MACPVDGAVPIAEEHEPVAGPLEAPDVPGWKLGAPLGWGGQAAVWRARGDGDGPVEMAVAVRTISCTTRSAIPLALPPIRTPPRARLAAPSGVCCLVHPTPPSPPRSAHGATRVSAYAVDATTLALQPWLKADHGHLLVELTPARALGQARGHLGAQPRE